MTKAALRKLIQTASGQIPAETVIQNCRILDVFTGVFKEGDIALCGGRIAGVGRYRGEREIDGEGRYAVPGLIDSHIHIESSYLCPEELGRLLVPHGTTTIIADPHEIVNVCGTAGLDYMMAAAENTALDILFMLPSCVPATPFEHAGAEMGAAEMAEPLRRDKVLGLGEFMNFPGLLNGEDGVLDKLLLAQAAGKLIDGHSPGLTGLGLNGYAAAGILGDHECGTAAAMEERHDYVGDLERMLYPLSAAPEEDWALAGVNDGSGANGAPRSGSRWRFVEGEGVEDGLVCTEPAEGLTAGGAEGAGEGAREEVAGGAAAEANGTLLMLRDSFGNSLVPYLACEFQRAGFSKMLPYDLLRVREERPSVVVVERAQRHEAYWAEEAPLMPCPRVEVQAAGREPMAVEATATVDGPLLRLKGRVAGLAARWPEADVFVRLEGADGQGATYEAFALSDGSSDDGFCLSVSAEAWSRRATRAVVLVGEPEAAVAVGEMPLDAGALAS